MSNGYAAEIKRIYAEFGKVKQQDIQVAGPNDRAKFAFCLVYADRDLTPEAAATHAREYGFECTAILDPECLLARWTGATKKPEVAVMSAAGELLYRGRIDDRYADFGKRREQLTATELRDALRAIQQGKEIAVPRSTAIGCDIDMP
ncbi:MAG: hypothetical protein SFX18_14080 [Pirellulales bacterium]|nr:hypothetical protein [Pirellulales bacterium]